MHQITLTQHKATHPTKQPEWIMATSQAAARQMYATRHNVNADDVRVIN